mmetsp:Transcript_23321/g.36189  ORF Transcript_23321/g.36189 Transcript_23321/m.36189 type:complete len:92 (+) Transcript_23321:330-605(+)
MGFLKQTFVITVTVVVFFIVNNLTENKRNFSIPTVFFADHMQQSVAIAKSIAVVVVIAVMEQNRNIVVNYSLESYHILASNGHDSETNAIL